MSDGGEDNSDRGDGRSEEPDDDCSRLKRECTAMVEYLKELENEESELTIQNEILARECISNGWSMDLQEPKAAPKKRRTASTKGKATPQKEQPAPNSVNQEP